jgi:hypothetical protein
MPEVVKVPSAGQPAYEGEITTQQLDEIIGGLLIPNQAVAKALAKEVQVLRDQLNGCKIASRNYADGVAYGGTIPSGFGDAFKEVLRCRQSLDDALGGA